MTVTTGSSTTLRTRYTVAGVLAAPPVPPTLEVVDPLGAQVEYSTLDAIVTDGVGLFHCDVLIDVSGLWNYRWMVAGEAADEGTIEGWSEFDEVPSMPDLTNLRVLVPRTRRKCEGPFGPPPNKPALEDFQLYQMIADACSEIIMYSGTLFGHQLIVAERDPLVGFPTGWKTEAALDEWEAAVVTTQTALNYYFHVFRDLKTSQVISNEGTNWEYTLSANVIRDYLKTLKDERDSALAGLRAHHPIIDRYASNIRVRDQATVTILEWWDTHSPGISGSGVPGGQEASVIPWAPGWYGP